MKKKFNNFGRSMENMFRKDSLKFHGTNYDNWKENIKTHLVCMGLRYEILRKSTKIIIVKKDLETCSEAERDHFMCDLRAKEALLIKLPKIEYS